MNCEPGFGAFHRTTLEADLRDLGITHLILSGITTQCCVQSTLREAVDRGFYSLLLADCCAALDPALHAATLAIIQGEDHLFGWIAGSGALLDALERYKGE
jgi:nicotinamidase-related amidase